jgi:hypothetical protein
MEKVQRANGASCYHSPAETGADKELGSKENISPWRVQGMHIRTT